MSELPPGWPQETEQRLEKRRALQALGVNPYPTRYERSHRLAEIVAAYGEKTLEELDALDVSVSIAGRVMTKRGMGKASFATLSDGEGELQLYVRLNDVGEHGYRVFDLLDLGDFVGARGRVMRTRKHEMLTRASAVVALPGGTGTLEELFEAVTLKRLGLFAGPIVIVNTLGYYEPLLAQLRGAVDQRFMDPRHEAMWTVVAGPKDVLPAIESAASWDADSRDFAVVR